MPWSPQQQRRAPTTTTDEQQQLREQQQCEHVPGPSSSSAGAMVSSGPYAARSGGTGGAELPEGVYRQLREVDQQQSTLTARGVQGFSARVLNREEYKTPGYGQGEIRVVQLVEIIKKPGQSLGLYLREGNGVDQFTGVFVSRFGEQSELQRCGDILRPGDQILAVNNVLVREMAIDDVVLMLSIPRRLLLRTSFLKGQREQQAMRGPVERVERPVVVFQKVPDTDRRDSEASSSGILSKPASTAASWLGRKVRQQQQQKKQQQQQQQTIRHRQFPQQQNDPSGASATFSAGGHNIIGGTDAVAQTARIPPPRVQPIQQPPPLLPFFAPSASAPCSAPYFPRPPPQYASATLGRLPPASAPLQRRFLGTSGVGGGCCASIAAGADRIGAPPPANAASVPMRPTPHYQQNPHQPPPYGTLTTAPFTYGTTQQPMMTPYQSNSLPRRSMATMRPSQFQRTTRYFVPASSTHFPGSSLPFYANPSPPAYPPAGGGAFSDVDIGHVGRQRRNLLPNGSLIGGTGGGRTVADIFSAREYRNWASEDEDICGIGTGAEGGGRRSRWAQMARAGATVRSNSLPPKSVMANHLGSPRSNDQQQQQMAATSEAMSPAEKADILDRLHVSPLTNRRVPLRTAGPGFDVDRLSGSNALSGMLSVAIVEGRNLKVPDRVHSKQLYCVLEVDEQHRARTGISTPEQHFRWSERFDIDVLNATNASFFIYAWHPQLRHRFCHKGDIRLMDVFLVDGLSANRLFTLQLEPRGQLLMKIAFFDMANCFCRVRKPAESGLFGQSLGWIVQRENGEVPLLINRLVREIERRGLDTVGLYFLCGATERKDYLREQLNANCHDADIGERPVPDVNLLTCLVKDFLRELPEPLVPTNIYAMLLDAAGVMPSADKEENQRLVMRIVDCLAAPNKNLLVFLMDHFRALLASEPHNGLTMNRLLGLFGPLLFCTAQSLHSVNAPPKMVPSSSSTTGVSYQSSVQLDPLSAQQAGQALRLLLDYWPRVNGSSESNGSSAEGRGEEGGKRGRSDEAK